MKRTTKLFTTTLSTIFILVAMCGIALAQGAFPDQKLVAPAVIAYLLVTLLVTTPYLRWTRLQRSPTSVALPAAEPRVETSRLCSGVSP